MLYQNWISSLSPFTSQKLLGSVPDTAPAACLGTMGKDPGLPLHDYLLSLPIVPTQAGAVSMTTCTSLVLVVLWQRCTLAMVGH